MSNLFLSCVALGLLLSSGTPLCAPEPGGTSGTITLHCPPTAKFFCGGSTDPKFTGSASATTTCATSPQVTLTFADLQVPPTSCPADRFHANILRTWTATDACGNSESCTQEIHVLRQIWSLDAIPGTCPNTIDTRSGPGTITLALAGAPQQDVASVLPESVRVYTEACGAGPVAPTHIALADIARPSSGAVCGCTTLTADGVVDMQLDFDRSSLVHGLHLDTLAAGTKVRLVVTGTLSDGCTFIAIDCVQVQHSAGTEGCSLGYWKNHLAAWTPTGFHPSDDFDTVFGVDAFQPDRTLLQALQAGGGGLDNLGRQGVAALLDAAHPGIDFPLTVPDVVTLVHDAVIDGTEGTVATQLDALANLGCPLH